MMIHKKEFFMIRTSAKIMVLAAVLMFVTGFIFAQESNMLKSTFYEIGNDADNFMDTVGWKDLELNSIFAYSRFGANIPDGKVDIGIGVNPGPLYAGLYYKGPVIGLRNADSYSGKQSLPLTGKDPEQIPVSAKNKANPDAVYGVLVGLNGMGFKFTLKDNLGISGNRATLTENWYGSMIPAI